VARFTARLEPIESGTFVVIPAEVVEALRATGRTSVAKPAFDALAPSHRREYAELVAEAKRAETRQRRAAQAIERLRA
jgi:uncharacterized protein YdeI (YjbR/CyaY-like superfamily)